MKSTIKSFICMALILIMAACDKDGDKIFLSNLSEGELAVSMSDVLLSNANSKDIVLSVAWNIEKPQVSDASMSAPNLLTNTLQVSTKEDFSSNVTESREVSNTRTFKGADLNTVAKNIGAIPDEANDLYFRIKTTAGSNMEPVYTNTAKVSVTPYTIDMSVGFVLDKDQKETTTTLYSAASDGVYVGFMGATAWYNYYLMEGDGTVWGNDGVDETPFLMSSEDTKWNYWFPGMGGCYYVKVDTPKKVWSALYIPTLTLKGDVEGDMTFDRPNLKWMYIFTADKAGDITVNISGTGKQYDYATGTDDAAAVDTPLGFAQEGDKIVYASSASDIKVNVLAAGEYTLTLDLSDPRNFKLSAEAGSSKPVEISKEVYLGGIDDAIAGSWNFNTALSLYDEENLSYAGVAYAASHGYAVYTEKDNWEDKYAFASGDANEGVMVLNGENNIPAPADGLYFFDVSLKGLTYKTFHITDKIYYSGVNDNWDTLHEMAATAQSGVYQASITIEKASEWGFQIILDGGGWSYKYGGSNGKIYYKGDNFKDDATLAAGTYTFTVDLLNGTYTIE